MQVFFDRSKKAGVVCETSSQTSQLGGEIKVVDKNVGFALSPVVRERYESICNTGGDRGMLCVPRVGEDVVPMVTLFFESRCQEFF